MTLEQLARHQFVQQSSNTAAFLLGFFDNRFDGIPIAEGHASSYRVDSELLGQIL